MAGRPKQMLQALGRKRERLVPFHAARTTAATHSVEERGREQSALMRYPVVPQLVRCVAQWKTGWEKGCEGKEERGQRPRGEWVLSTHARRRRTCGTPRMRAAARARSGVSAKELGLRVPARAGRPRGCVPRTKTMERVVSGSGHTLIRVQRSVFLIAHVLVRPGRR